MNRQKLAQTKRTALNDKVLKQSFTPEGVEQQEFIKICQIKRFYERWLADRDFRKQFASDPSKTIKQYKLEVDPKELRPLWDKEFNNKNDCQSLASSSVQKFQKIFIEDLRNGKLLHSSILVKDFRFKSWRERQIARCASQFVRKHHETTAHFPVSFELSKGCSVGCWFCGISAPRLGDIFAYNQENAKLWHKTLQLIKDVFGDIAKEGFCYWATDPLDNPDYEQFCLDFYEILGKFPTTTTAQPLKDPQRVRSLLKLSASKDCPINRFSIISLKTFNQVHEEYSAEELAGVMLALQNPNPESLSQKAVSGRAWEREQRIKAKYVEPSQDSTQGSIACVTGFLFNMVERSVKLISPCNASDRWPNGYIVFDEGTFSDIDSLKILLEKMIENNMPLTVSKEAKIKFRHDLKYDSLPDGFQLSTKHLTRKFCNQPYFKELGRPCFKKLGEIIQNGDKTKEEITLLFETLGVPRVNTVHFLNFLFNKGVLDEEPKQQNSTKKILVTPV